jgi:DNA-binding PadR family transcriptional regulator
MSLPTTTKTDLLLLGLLLDRPMHGYDLYQQIQAEGIDDWYSISAAGVYYSLRKLRDLGWVEESRHGRRGSARKSIYRMTEKGRSSFFAALEEELASQEQTCLDYDLAIYLLNRMPLRRAIPPLEGRQTYLADQVRSAQAALQAGVSEGRSALNVAILDHKLRFLQMEQEWLAGLIQGIQQDAEAGPDQSGERRGLMILDGDLRDFHLPDLFHLILSGRHSGTLRVSDGSEVRTLVFEKGQPVCASAYRRGQVPNAASSCDEVLARLCELFRWQEGSFTFDQRVEYQDWSVPLECSAEELIFRGCRKVDNWAIIQRLVPSADSIFELGPAAQSMEHITLTPVEERLVAAVDGVKSVAAIARELDLTLFETSRIVYCLTAVGALHTADVDKIRLRRAFREIAELMCGETMTWRDSPGDRSCEEEVNQRTADLPLSLDLGHIRDQADPQLGVEELRGMYTRFLKEQFKVVSRRFGRANAQQAHERSLRQLAPELQEVARRYGFDRVSRN